LTVSFAGGLNLSQPVRVDAEQPNAITIFTFGGGIVIDGGTDDTNDGDNVADAVEALAPNEGDGNGDGVKDYEQPNVTSLPVNGGELGSGQNYVTVAVPAGVELSNVYTIPIDDTDRIETPPPAGVTLPEGLTNMVLKGVEPGSDQVISIFTSSTQNVSGYAKYNPNTKQWSLLPEDRVEIFDNRVEIRLTDGGIGDDDGEVNGRISDPGGIAIIENLDELAPAVVGEVVEQPNAEGWYRDDVTVRWTATDPEPSAGQPAAPNDTVVGGEGDNLRAVSEEVCDGAGNCATGSLDGIKIDRTKPEVSVAGVRDGEVYTVGAVPVATCEASDALSGVAGACAGTLSGGNANGVGDFVYEAQAVDRAGNARTVSVSYKVVYRFDGFLQPINDPVANPGAARSVFKSGSTLPVKFQVKRADGSVITPTAAPVWVNPALGTATNAAVNEESWAEAVSSGSAFSLVDGKWQYNWKTKGVSAGYNYRLGVTLDDGTTHYVVVAAR
jgi:hypothetical protein